MKKRMGFSLLEVLVALAVVSIALSAAFTLMSRSIDNLSLLEKKVIATWVAENQIAYLRINELSTDSSSATLQGEEEMAGRTWFWKALIKATEDETVNRLLMSVSLSPDMATIDAEITAYLPVTRS